VLAFTDADCIPAANWIEQGITQLLRQPGIGLVGGRIQVFMQNQSNPTALELYDYVLAFPQHEYIELYHYGATANVFTFPEVFERVGLFNETLLSGGDREWGQRVAAAGYPLLYAHNVIVQHPARRSLTQFLHKLTRTAIGMGNITSMQPISARTRSAHTQKLPMYNIRKSLRTLVRAATTERLQRADQRLSVIFIMLLREICWISVFSYVRIVKRIEQTLSGHSRRRHSQK
jgi:cellulose synthase/poly-beta-1,6-N-acetylglucosamine synthase-like glycosyltransferase